MKFIWYSIMLVFVVLIVLTVGILMSGCSSLRYGIFSQNQIDDMCQIEQAIGEIKGYHRGYIDGLKDCKTLQIK